MNKTIKDSIFRILDSELSCKRILERLKSEKNHFIGIWGLDEYNLRIKLITEYINNPEEFKRRMEKKES